MQQLTFSSVLSTDTVPAMRLGSVDYTPDGKRWRYIRADDALAKGNIVSPVANTDVDTVSSATNNDAQIVFITEASAGWTVGQFQNAYGVVDDGTGEGQSFIVKDNTADTLELYVDWRLTTALAVADSDIVLVRKWLSRLTPITTLNTPVSGVAQVAFADNDYGWVMEEGVAGILAGAALVANEQATPGDDTAGQVTGIGAGETPDDVFMVGHCLVANTTADEEALVDVLLS